MQEAKCKAGGAKQWGKGRESRLSAAQEAYYKLLKEVEMMKNGENPDVY